MNLTGNKLVNDLIDEYTWRLQIRRTQRELFDIWDWFDPTGDRFDELCAPVPSKRSKFFYNNILSHCRAGRRVARISQKI